MNKEQQTSASFIINPFIDGKVMYKNLEKLGKDYVWLKKQTEKFGIKPEDALIVTIDGNNQFFCQAKEKGDNS